MFFRNTYYSCGRSLHPGVQMDIDEFNAGATLASHPAGWGGGSGVVEKFLVASCHRNLDMLLPDGLLGSY